MRTRTGCQGCQDLHYTYIRQIMPVLSGLNETLDFLKQTPDDEPALHGIRKEAGRISDLAMIHGFDAVQVISERISQSVGRALRADLPERKRILKSVESSLRALHTVLRLEEFLEHRMTVEKVGSTVERGERKVRFRTQKALQQLKVDAPERADARELQTAGAENRLMFDINDSETVIHLSDVPEFESGQEPAMASELHSGSLA